MKFDSTALPLMPTPEQLNELSDALISAQELYQLYITLEQHPRVKRLPQLFELFNACQDQVIQDIIILGQQIEQLGVSARVGSDVHRQKEDQNEQDLEEYAETHELDPLHAFGIVPDLQRPSLQLSVYELVKKTFSAEEFLTGQLRSCLKSAQNLKQIKLELQLKMAVLSAEQRYKLLQHQYGFSPGALLSDFSRKTTKMIFGVFGKD